MRFDNPTKKKSFAKSLTSLKFAVNGRMGRPRLDTFLYICGTKGCGYLVAEHSQLPD